MVASLLALKSLKSSRMEHNSKRKSIESQPILAFSYIFLNAIKTLYLRQCYIALMLYPLQQKLLMKNVINCALFLAILITRGILMILLFLSLETLEQA